MLIICARRLAKNHQYQAIKADDDYGENEGEHFALDRKDDDLILTSDGPKGVPDKEEFDISSLMTDSDSIGSEQTRRSRRVGLSYLTRNVGFIRSKKNSELCNKTDNNTAMLHHSVNTTSPTRERRCLAGNILEIENLPSTSKGGPTHVKLHITLLPCKRHAHKTEWVEVVDDGRVVFNDCYSYDLSRSHPEKEKQMRIRAFGRRPADSNILTKKWVAECVLDMTIVEREKGLDFWVALSNKKIPGSRESANTSVISEEISEME